jgi:hypothetical protein
MLLCTRYGFYSVASAQKKSGAVDPAKMMVRARQKPRNQEETRKNQEQCRITHFFRLWATG